MTLDDPFREALPLMAPIVTVDLRRLIAEAEAQVKAILVDELVWPTPRRTYGYALKLWCAWYALRFGAPLQRVESL